MEKETIYVKVDPTHWSVRMKHMIEGAIIMFFIIVLLERLGIQ